MNKSFPTQPHASGLHLPKSRLNVIAVTLGIDLVFFLLLLVIGLQANVDIAALMRDPVATAQLPFYTGIFSSLGILFWCITATTCIFGSLLLARFEVRRDMQVFLWYSGCLSLFLTLDDLFLLHEYDGFFPVILGIPEKVVYLAYGIIVAAYFLHFRRIFFTSRSRLLIFLALGLLAFSLAFDAVLADFLPIPYQLGVLIEDGAKLLGIISWCGFFVSTCTDIPAWITAKSEADLS